MARYFCDECANFAFQLLAHPAEHSSLQRTSENVVAMA
jgi:hypothetical protein